MIITNQQLFAKAAEMTANYLGCPKEHLALDTDLISEYYMDSLDLVDLGVEIEPLLFKGEGFRRTDVVGVISG